MVPSQNLPLVSIITVVFNGESYLEQTIKSVLNQTYKNIEYLIIDGGSTDNTLNIIKKYDSFISHWISEEDNGLYDAMNKGINMVNGILIGMINSDDWYEKNAVELNVNAYLKNQNKQIFHADRYNIDGNGNRSIYKYKPSAWRFKYHGMTFNHPSMFITKKEYEQHQYSTKFRSHADYLFVLEAWLKDSSKFHYLEHPIVNYRLQGISSSLSFTKMLQEEYAVRRESGMPLISVYFSIFYKSLVYIPLKIKAKIF